MPGYRLRREPSRPPTTLWRRLCRLAVAQLADGLVPPPADATTREQLEWLAADVVAAEGSAGVWLARPTTEAQERGPAAARSEASAALRPIESAVAARTPEPAR